MGATVKVSRASFRTVRITFALSGGARKILTSSWPEPQDQARVKSASRGNWAPDILPARRNFEAFTRAQPLIKTKHRIMKMFRLFVALTLTRFAISPRSEER